MADSTKIEWTEATWNPITGCSVTSPGCTNCYAMKLAGTRLAHHQSRAGLTQDSKAGPVWTGEVRFNKQWLDQPLRWKRPRMIFVCAHGDLFHESVADEWIDRVFAVMALCPQHTFQVLTKRSARMREYLTSLLRPAKICPDAVLKIPQVGRDTMVANAMWPLPNVWLGVSVEDQQRADERIPDLLTTPAAVRFLSCEPLLGEIDLTQISTWRFRGAELLDALTGTLTGMFGDPCRTRLPRIEWIIVGGESGPGARPMHADWARSLRDQCAAAGVPFFFKQWGEWGPDTGPDEDFHRDGLRRDRVLEGAGPCAALVQGNWHFADDGYAMPLDNGSDGEWVYRLGKKRNGRLLDGVLHDAMPERAQ